MAGTRLLGVHGLLRSESDFQCDLPSRDLFRVQSCPVIARGGGGE